MVNKPIVEIKWNMQKKKKKSQEKEENETGQIENKQLYNRDNPII